MISIYFSGLINMLNEQNRETTTGMIVKYDVLMPEYNWEILKNLKKLIEMMAR